MLFSLKSSSVNPSIRIRPLKGGKRGREGRRGRERERVCMSVCVCVLVGQSIEFIPTISMIKFQSICMCQYNYLNTLHVVTHTRTANTSSCVCIIQTHRSLQNTLGRSVNRFMLRYSRCRDRLCSYNDAGIVARFWLE